MVLQRDCRFHWQSFCLALKMWKIEIPETSRRVGLRRDFSVIIDDGTPTNIAYKGDGVKSLAALGILKNMHRRAELRLSLSRSLSRTSTRAQFTNWLISSPLAEENQVITRHNPLFVDRSNIKSNIVVNDGKASAAKSVAAIRDSLGLLRHLITWPMQTLLWLLKVRKMLLPWRRCFHC